jgi:hypothetical protein
MDQVSGGVRSYGHGGGAPGMNGDLTIYPQSGLCGRRSREHGSACGAAHGNIHWQSPAG